MSTPGIGSSAQLAFLGALLALEKHDPDTAVTHLGEMVEEHWGEVRAASGVSAHRYYAVLNPALLLEVAEAYVFKCDVVGGSGARGALSVPPPPHPSLYVHSAGTPCTP